MAKFKFCVEYRQLQTICERGYYRGTVEATDEAEARKIALEWVDSYERYELPDFHQWVRDEELIDTDAPVIIDESLEMEKVQDE